MSDEEEGSVSDDSEFENEPKSGTDYVVQKPEKRGKRRNELRREKNKSCASKRGKGERR